MTAKMSQKSSCEICGEKAGQKSCGYPSRHRKNHFYIWKSSLRWVNQPQWLPFVSIRRVCRKPWSIILFRGRTSPGEYKRADYHSAIKRRHANSDSWAHVNPLVNSSGAPDHFWLWNALLQENEVVNIPEQPAKGKECCCMSLATF